MFAFLLTIVGSLAFRVLFALGMGIVSYSALTDVFDAVESLVHSSISTISLSVYQLLNLAGFSDTVSILLAAFAVKISFIPLKSFRLK